MEILIEKLVWAWEDMNFLIAGAIFVAYFVYDLAYAHYMISVTQLKAGSAALFGSFVYFISAFGVLNYVENFLFIVPMTLGGMLGTYVAISREKSKQLRKKMMKSKVPLP